MGAITIIDYGSGNLRSVARALAEVAGKREIVLTDMPQKIADAAHLVLPGVGAFEACFAALAKKRAALEALTIAVLEKAKPFLGICVGMQLMADRGLEYETCEGLGWIGGESVAIPNSAGLLIPHMGWNRVETLMPHPLFDALHEEDLYFAHSFVLDGVAAEHVVATCRYGTDLCAAIARDNIIGTQFHPEKSQKVGLAFLERFVQWRP